MYVRGSVLNVNLIKKHHGTKCVIVAWLQKVRRTGGRTVAAMCNVGKCW